MGEDQAAQQPEQPSHDQRDQQRPLERVADRQALAGDPAADQPIAAGKLVHHQRRLTRCRLAAQSDQRVEVAFAEFEQRRRHRFQIALDLASVGTKDRDGRLRIRIGDRVLNGVVQRRLAAGAIDIGQHLALLNHLLVERRRGLVVRPVIDEADDREVRHERQ